MLINLDSNIINLLHIFVLSVILGYIGFMKEKGNKIVFLLLGIWASMIFLFVPLPKFDKNFLSYWNIIKLAHYIIFLPSLLYLSYYGYNNKFSNNSYNSILLVAIFIAIYHLYKLYTRLIK